MTSDSRYPSRELYPEIVRFGRLGTAIAEALKSRGISLDEETRPRASRFWAYFTHGSRKAVIASAKLERLFTVYASRQGVGLFSLATPDLERIAVVIESWLIQKSSLRNMQLAMPDITIATLAYAFEEGRYIEAVWAEMLSDDVLRNRLRAPLVPLTSAAAKHPVLRQLLPFQSHNTLRFSRAIGPPYNIAQLPYAEVTGKLFFRDSKEDGGYVAYTREGVVLGKGTPEEVIAMIVASLPDDLGPAVLVEPND